MGFLVPNAGIAVTQTTLLPKQKYPVDLRIVVSDKSDLTDTTLWIENFIDKRYAGMLVAVVQDSTAENNGVYFLQTFAHRNYFKDPQHSGGWTKIGSDQQQQQINIDNYTIKNGWESAQQTDVPQSGLHVVRIDGGIF